MQETSIEFVPSFKVKRGYPNLKVLVACLLLVLEVCNVKPTYRKSWARNLLMWSDFTLGSSFEVKRWLIGFGEIFFLVDTICIGFPMRRSTFELQ